MNVLILGLGAESQIIRGDQLGGAIGARVRRNLDVADLAWAEVVVLLKRAGPKWADAVHAAGKPLVWDALDFWAQPNENGLERGAAIDLLREWQRTIRPAVTICATHAMASVCDGVYLPHHARPDQVVYPVRNVVRTVAYEGVPKYLGRWRNAIARECLRRGWQFLVNPPHLGCADIIVAFRDESWDGWMCRNWKSGVKYVNAMTVGRPVITQSHSAFDELDTHGMTVESPEGLSTAFEWYVEKEPREAAMVQDAPTLATVAQTYLTILESVAVRC